MLSRAGYHHGKRNETLHVPYVQEWYGGVAQIENQAGKGWPVVGVSAESGP
jgi:hypothetical protein